MQETLQKQRTFALVGNSGNGKTSLAEMLLFQANATTRLGQVDKGSSVLDYEPEEMKRVGSIQPSFAHYTWQKNDHFCIDTPGDTNFVGDLPYLLTAVDSVVFVVDAVDGVKPLTKKLWSEVQKAELPAIIAVNKIDRERADFDQTFDGLSSILGIKPVLTYMPIGAESDFRGVVDVLGQKAFFFEDDGSVKEGEIPAQMTDQVEEIREITLENIAESDDELMEKYLEEGELSDDDVRKGLHIGVCNRTIVPVCATAAASGKGGTLILNLIQNLLPSPLERAAWTGTEGETRPSSPDEPTACFVCKTIVDPFSGQLSILRVLSGTLSPDVQLLNPEKESKEKIGHLQYLLGKHQTPCKTAVGPGALVAVTKLKDTATGNLLCAPEAPFVLNKPDLPPALLSYAIAAKEKGDEDKIFGAIHKMLDEDITLHLDRNEETGDMLLSGMGQLHIETAIERVKRRYKVEVQLNTPKIPYRETFKGKADVQGRHKKQSGGRGQFGDCWIRVEPRERGAGYEFEDAIVGGVIPKTFIPAVDKGIQETAGKGILAGAPVVDFKVTLYDGSYHSVDSSEMAFKVAGSMAFKKAAEQAGLKLLEPVVQMHIAVPEEYMGDIIGDLSSRRGKVLGYETTQGITEITAHVPMAEVLKYAPDLRSMTGGQGTFTMEFDHYSECPSNIEEKVVAENQQTE